MLVLLPLINAIIVFLDLLGRQEMANIRLKGWRWALLQVILIMGAFIALQSEILGLFKLLSTPFVAVSWLVALLLSIWLGVRIGWLKLGWARFQARIHLPDRFTTLTLIAFSFIIILLLVIVLIAPANTMDSLLYHMSRVMHWAQDRGLAHYPTGFTPQLTNPIEAELIILQLRLLFGSDRLASLPQWISLVVCAIGVSVGAKLMGAGRKGQWVAAAFAISIPIGLLEATSTQNDYVTAMWLIILAVFVLAACQQDPGWAEILSIAAALGLGLLTKGTFYPYAIAWGIWLMIHWLRQRKPLIFLRPALVIVTVVVVLNAGYWIRNISTFSSPFGSPKWLTSMTSATYGASSIPSNFVKNIFLNFATPSPRINQSVANFIQSAFRATDPDVSSFQLDWRWNNEESAGSPIHLVLIVLAIGVVILLVALGRLKSQPIAWYSLAAFFTFVFFVLIAHYDQTGVRYQLPLLVIWAPVIGVLLSRMGEKWLAPLAILIFFIISLPYTFFNTSRPLIAAKNDPEPFAIHPLPAMGTTKSSSIFYATTSELLFINVPQMVDPLTQSAHDLRESGCTQLGLRIDSHDAEYPIWWSLHAPHRGVRIETIYFSQLLSSVADPNFKPCAILCTICGGRNQLNGLKLFGSYDGIVNLYVGDTYSPDEDK
ncbi:MAG TPA: glycosyltransferase family 39 protein [Anaerolineales bacterium]|nr:glycosyltransferase family 39 protein [Anaerolineales bacterium]